MSNPVLVEATRGGRIESRHRGAIAVMDEKGAVVFSLGDIEQPVFPRSAVKVMQAMPLVESGAAEAFGFADRELALACASHSGEPAHVELASRMLERAGLGEGHLECGCHWPFDHHVMLPLARSGKTPGPLHNNCSGKHAGFLATTVHTGSDPKGYSRYDHPIQREIRSVMSELTGAAFGTDNCGTDGCAIPSYAVPLSRIAHGLARMASGAGLGEERRRAAARLISACMAEPFYVSGSRRACHALMTAAPGRIFAKTGAEGVFCAILPEKGLGIALKCDDGATRAAEAMVAAVLARFFKPSDPAVEALNALADRPQKNWNGAETGRVRALVDLAV